MSDKPLITKGPGYCVGQQWFPQVREAQVAAINSLLGMDSDPNGKTAKAILDHAGDIIDILKMAPRDKPAAKTYTTAEYEAASKEHGVPVKILRQRTTTGGKSLADAATTPYTPRSRGGKEVKNES